MRVLVIEDSERLRRSLEHGLHRSGFAVDLARDGEEGLAYARSGTYDVILLDLMLPGTDGLTVLRTLRGTGSNAHVLILSAKDRVEERVQGLQEGADDYLTKPFAFDELVARLRALTRRRYGTKNPVQAIGPLRFDSGRRVVLHGQEVVPLTRNEFAILDYLLARRGRVVSKGELLDHLYGDAGHGSENAVEVFVHQLRKKTQVPGHADLIRTRRGHGYLIE